MKHLSISVVIALHGEDNVSHENSSSPVTAVHSFIHSTTVYWNPVCARHSSSSGENKTCPYRHPQEPLFAL